MDSEGSNSPPGSLSGQQQQTTPLTSSTPAPVYTQYTTQNSQYPPQNNSQNYTPQTNNSQQQPSVYSSNYYSTVAPYYTSPRLSPVSSRKTSLESAPPVLCQTPTIVLSSVGCREETTTPPNKQAQPGTGAGSVWKDSMFVLVAYKTEPCKRAARLCRQGYACPNYHNNKDRRRSPKIWKYRSTPCPLVKSNDEWGDPSVCEHQDSCGYCHTRTEQQFHPEIYKSTRCKDMQQYLFCPRGPFCAFAHDDDEAQIVYDISDTQYPDTTSPPTSVSGIIGDKRSRSYTHTGLALEARARSGSNDSRIRSLSLIDSLQNMSVSGQHPVPVHNAAAHAVAHPSPALPDSRMRSQSQGSGENSNGNLLPDPRESSPRVAAQVLTEATKAATLAAVQHQQLAGFDSEHNNFYGNTSLPSEISGVNGHFPGHISAGPQHPEYNASHANFPASAEPHNTAEYSMMLNGLINSSSVTDQRRMKAEQAVLIQQHQQQEQQRVLVNESLETLKAINKLTTSLVFNASKLPLNVLVHIRQQYTRTLEEINSMLAVRKQMACIVCVDRPRDALIHPCSHYVSCQECLKTHKYCPACNELIQRIYNVCI